MKKKINRILHTLQHTYGITPLNTSEDICHITVSARMTRIVNLPNLRLYLRTLSKAAGLECEIDCGGGYLQLTFHMAERHVAVEY